MNEKQIIEDQRDMIKALQRLTDDMSRQLEGKDEMISTLLAKVDSLESTVSDMNEKVQVLLDQISTYQRKLFGTSSEKNHGHDEDGKEGSDKPDDKGDGNGGSNGGAVAGGSSKKKNYKHPHKRSYADIEPEDVIEIKPDAEEMKGARLVKIIGSYRFYWIPGRLCKVLYQRYIYKKDGHLLIPRLPYVPEAMEKRHASPELIAKILTDKYYYHIPIERQLTMLKAGKIDIPKATFHDWVAAGIDSLDGLYEEIRSTVLSDERMHVDETTSRVVDTEKHNTLSTYDWGFISPKFKMMFFTRTDGSRGADVLDEQLKYFKGKYINTDGYTAYTNASARIGRELVHIPCMSHIRRKFIDSLQYHEILAREALSYIDAIFSNEKNYREEKLTKEQIENRRTIELRPLLDKFKAWLERHALSGKIYEQSNLGKAIAYARNLIDKFYEVIKNGKLVIDNNIAERTMRSHAMGRNSYLFCQNEDSAVRTSKIYSIMESCRLSKIDPYKYLVKVLSSKPESGETWQSLLPCNINIR